MKTKISSLIFINIFLVSCTSTTATSSIGKTLTPVTVKDSVVTNTPTEVPTETPTTTPVDVLTIPTAQLVNEVINGQMEYPTNLQELSQAKYREFSILFAQELSALSPEGNIITKKIGNTTYDIYWNAERNEWDAVPAGQEVANKGEFYPTVVPLFKNEAGQWCVTDTNGNDIPLPDKFFAGKSFMDWAIAGPAELNAQLPHLVVDARLETMPDFPAEKIDAVRNEYANNQPIKLVAVINPNHSQGSNITAAEWVHPAKGATIDFSAESARIYENQTNTLMIPIILNGQPIAAINLSQRFRPSYIIIEYDQNDNIVDYSGWGAGEAGQNYRTFGQRDGDNWVILTARQTPDSAEDAGGGDIFNETGTADYFSVLSKIQNITSIAELKQILEGANFFYGEAYSLIFQR